MKLIKKQDNNGNDYYEEILETDEEIKKSLEQTNIKRNKKNKITLIVFILSLIITIVDLLMLFNKIDINILGEKQKIIEWIILIIGIIGMEESTRRRK